MIKTISIFLLFPMLVNSQIIADTSYFSAGGGNWTKVVTYRNASTTTFIPKQDTVLLAVTKYKLDSTAAALAASVAATYATITTVNGKLATNGSAASLTNFPTLNQNTSGTSSNVTGVVSFANGGISAAAATSATTGTMTVNMTTSVVTITPTGACTFNGSGGVAGQVVTFVITTSGTTSFTLTWGTNFRKTGTLATGTTSARFFSVTFICVNGTTWQEISRTIVQT